VQYPIKPEKEIVSYLVAPNLIRIKHIFLSGARSFKGLPYKKWKISIEVVKLDVKLNIHFVRYIFPSTYPHPSIKIEKTNPEFSYETSCYQSGTIQCVLDFGRRKSVKLPYFLDYDNELPMGKTYPFSTP
jgi:hypothetical protein